MATYAQRQEILDRLEAYARELGLDWIICHGTRGFPPLYQTTPACYWLSTVGDTDLRPEQCLGLTEVQARTTIEYVGRFVDAKTPLYRDASAVQALIGGPR